METQTSENSTETQQSLKRPRKLNSEKPEFAIHDDYKEVKAFYKRCRSGEKYTTRLMDQEAYIERSKNPRDVSRKLYQHPVALHEVMYNDKPSGKP